jgi:hypothetical protein
MISNNRGFRVLANLNQCPGGSRRGRDSDASASDNLDLKMIRPGRGISGRPAADPAWPALASVSLTVIAGQEDRRLILPNSAQFVSEGGAQRLAIKAVDLSRWSSRSSAGRASQTSSSFSSPRRLTVLAFKLQSFRVIRVMMPGRGRGHDHDACTQNLNTGRGDDSDSVPDHRSDSESDAPGPSELLIDYGPRSPSPGPSR